jgi:hypothetical protein
MRYGDLVNQSRFTDPASQTSLGDREVWNSKLATEVIGIHIWCRPRQGSPEPSRAVLCSALFHAKIGHLRTSARTSLLSISQVDLPPGQRFFLSLPAPPAAYYGQMSSHRAEAADRACGVVCDRTARAVCCSLAHRPGTAAVGASSGSCPGLSRRVRSSCSFCVYA